MSGLAGDCFAYGGGRIAVRATVILDPLATTSGARKRDRLKLRVAVVKKRATKRKTRTTKALACLPCRPEPATT